MLAGALWVPLYGEQVGQGWLYAKGVFMPDSFGWPAAVAITLSALAAFYFFVAWLDNRAKTAN